MSPLCATIIVCRGAIYTRHGGSVAHRNMFVAVRGACLVSLGSGAVKFSVECECEGFATYCLNDLGDMVQEKDCNDKGLKDSNGRVLRYGYCTGHSCIVGLANRSACFPASSRVMLFDANSEPRPVPIEDVRVGDELLVRAQSSRCCRSHNMCRSWPQMEWPNVAP